MNLTDEDIERIANRCYEVWCRRSMSAIEAGRAERRLAREASLSRQHPLKETQPSGSDH